MVISSVDIGTNTVLLLIARTGTKNSKIIPLLNEYSIPRIGKNVSSGGVIAGDSIEKLKNILIEYKRISSENNSEVFIAAATAAFRKAKNRDEVIKHIRSAIGIDIKVITGEEEALYAYLGVSDGVHDDRKRLIIDIGGGSTEVICGIREKIIYRKSFDTGVVSSSEIYKSSRRFAEDIREHYDSVFSELQAADLNGDSCYAIAGTPTTLAAVKLGLTQFDDNKVEGTILTRMDIEKFIKSYTSTPGDYLQKYKRILEGREDLIIPGSLILLTIMKYLSLGEINVSTRGIRHGAIIQYLSSQG